MTFPAPATDNNALLLIHDAAGGVTWHHPDQPTAATQKFLSWPADQSTDASDPPGSGESSPGVTFTVPRTRFPGSAHLNVLHEVGQLFRHFTLHDGKGAGPVHSIVSLLEYPIANLASMGADAWIDRWDRDKHPVAIRWFPPNGGHHVPETLSPTNWAELAKGKTLLFVHGIFSSCNSGFSSLIKDDTFWASLQDRYQGRIIGYDHPTVSVDPLKNAAEFLAQIPDGITLDVDIVCHSRGGLVARCLAGGTAAAGDQFAVKGTDKVKVGKIIFAATPNGGSSITDPAKWGSFVDRISSLLTLPGLVFPPPVDEVAGIIASVLELIKVVAVDSAVKLPGLEAMKPGSDLLQALGTYTGAYPKLFGVGSSYQPGALLAHVFNGLDDASQIVDDLVFKSIANDIAVPTYGVANPADPGTPPPDEPGDSGGFPIAGSDWLLLDGTPQYWHSAYFDDATVRQAILKWLQQPEAPANSPAVAPAGG